ncbi:hypothetical protein ABK040_012683 [Willaertia magna]
MSTSNNKKQKTNKADLTIDHELINNQMADELSNESIESIENIKDSFTVKEIIDSDGYNKNNDENNKTINDSNNKENVEEMVNFNELITESTRNKYLFIILDKTATKERGIDKEEINKKVKVKIGNIHPINNSIINDALIVKTYDPYKADYIASLENDTYAIYPISNDNSDIRNAWFNVNPEIFAECDIELVNHIESEIIENIDVQIVNIFKIKKSKTGQTFIVTFKTLEERELACTKGVFVIEDLEGKNKSYAKFTMMDYLEISHHNEIVCYCPNTGIDFEDEKIFNKFCDLIKSNYNNNEELINTMVIQQNCIKFTLSTDKHNKLVYQPIQQLSKFKFEFARNIKNLKNFMKEFANFGNQKQTEHLLKNQATVTKEEVNKLIKDLEEERHKDMKKLQQENIKNQNQLLKTITEQNVNNNNKLIKEIMNGVVTMLNNNNLYLLEREEIKQNINDLKRKRDMLEFKCLINNNINPKEVENQYANINEEIKALEVQLKHTRAISNTMIDSKGNAPIIEDEMSDEDDKQ